MKTRERNIYSIGRTWGAAFLVVVSASLAFSAAPGWAQCEDVGGAGDQYCEGLPGGGGQQGVRQPRVNGGVPEATGRSLDRAKAGAVRLVESPRQEGRRRAKVAASSPPAATSDSQQASALPYILAAVSLVLLGAALLARRRTRGSDGGDTAP